MILQRSRPSIIRLGDPPPFGVERVGVARRRDELVLGPRPDLEDLGVDRRQRLHLVSVIAGGREAGAGRRRDPEFGQVSLRCARSVPGITPSPEQVVNRRSLGCTHRAASSMKALEGLMRNLSRRSILIGLPTLVTVAADRVLLAAEAAPQVAEKRLALSGYDPVSYFTEGRPEKGSAEYSAAFDDATYWFKNAEHRALFVADPDHYAPQFARLLRRDHSVARRENRRRIRRLGRLRTASSTSSRRSRACLVPSSRPPASSKRPPRNWPEMRKQP